MHNVTSRRAHVAAVSKLAAAAPLAGCGGDSSSRTTTSTSADALALQDQYEFGDAPAAGIGFAIPSNPVRQVAHRSNRVRYPMMYRRGVLTALALLALVVVGAALQVALRGTTQPPNAAATPTATATASPTPTPTAAEQAVLRSLAAVERAYDAGDVRRLCRPGALVDPTVVRGHGRACESDLESLIANVPQLRITVRGIAMRSDLATATVLIANDASTTVDFVRDGQGWLLSFSNGGDPFPALAGTT